MISNDQRRWCREVLLLHIGDHLVPAFLARRRIKRDEIIVGRFKEQPVAVHSHAAIADVNATLRLPKVMPELSAGTRIHRKGIIRRREVEDAIHHEWNRLDTS